MWSIQPLRGGLQSPRSQPSKASTGDGGDIVRTHYSRSPTRRLAAAGLEATRPATISAPVGSRMFPPAMVERQLAAAGLEATGPATISAPVGSCTVPLAMAERQRVATARVHTGQLCTPPRGIRQGPPATAATSASATVPTARHRTGSSPGSATSSPRTHRSGTSGVCSPRYPVSSMPLPLRATQPAVSSQAASRGSSRMHGAASVTRTGMSAAAAAAAARQASPASMQRSLQQLESVRCQAQAEFWAL